MAHSPRSPYSLLADDNQQISIDAKYKKALKAHIIITLTFNDNMVFSDNQLVTSPNLRDLIARDGVIRELSKEKLFSLAARQGHDESAPSQIQTLLETQKQFFAQGKITSERIDIGRVKDLDFADQHFRKIGWNYREVRQHFTDVVATLLCDQFSPLLSPSDFRTFSEILSEERERDRGLGREFLQRRFPSLVMQRLVNPPEQTHQLIHDCTEGPYISNLPRVLSLNPIYASSHARSFETMRGLKLAQLEPAFSFKSKPRLSYEHYIEGLSRLDVDDIMWLRQTDELKEYQSFAHRDLSKSAVAHDLTVSFQSINQRIVDRIIDRFPELKASTSEAPDQIIRSRWAKAEFAGGILLEAIGAAVELQTGLGLGISVLFSLAERKFGASNKRISQHDNAQWEARNRQLGHLLEDKGMDAKIAFEMPVLNHFEKETIVRGL
ncbi:hypothetical protein [Agrobacterium sp. NPDC089420]|uniref:hypothetical protein n=1 Tax=Agrobacterium sp. NPDC089420 TaxID=3363918 RepID=UPI00384B90A4